MHNRRDFATISLPVLAGSHLCPVVALKVMFQRFPGSDNSPVFVIPRLTGMVPLTDSVARKHLKDISRSLGLDISLRFHDFRWGGGCLGLSAWSAPGAYDETWYLEIGHYLGLSFLYCHCYISRCPCISTGFMPLILLGFGYLLSSSVHVHCLYMIAKQF